MSNVHIVLRRRVSSSPPAGNCPLDFVFLTYGQDGALTNEHFEQDQPSFLCILNQQGSKTAPAVIFVATIHQRAAAAAASAGPTFAALGLCCGLMRRQSCKTWLAFIVASLCASWRCRPQLREGPVIQHDLLYSSRFLKYVLYIHNVYVLFTCKAEGLYAYHLYFSRRKIDDIDILPISGRCACIAQFSMYCTF